MADSETFTLQLKAFAEKAEANASKVVRGASIDLLSRVVMRTPVGNPDLWKSKPPKGYVGGRLRANWNVSLTTPDESTADSIDKTGVATIARGNEAIAGADGKEDIWMVNALPYAIPIEYGHSQAQAPAGMVRVSVGEWQKYVNAQAVKVANE